MNYMLCYVDQGQPGYIRSSQIRALLNPTKHAQHIAEIDRIEHDGIWYSNQDHDVLSAAWAAVKWQKPPQDTAEPS